MIVALDPGFGNTKVSVGSQTVVMQSAVARMRSIGRAGEGLKLAEAACEVRTASGTYATGRNAWWWGEPIMGGMDYGSLASEPRRVLFYAALAQALTEGEHAIDLVIGLPVPLLMDNSQAPVVLEQLKSTYKGVHEFLVDGRQYQVEIGKASVLPQPVGAWADWLMDDELRPRKGGSQAEVAVIDIGMNTLDMIVVRGGQVEPRYIGGARAGVRKILAGLNGHGLDIEEVDDALRTGQVKAERMAMETWCNEILGHVEKTLPDLRRFAAVIPTGGGAALLGGMLYTALVARGAALFCPNDAVTSNVSGLRKYTAYKASKRAA